MPSSMRNRLQEQRAAPQVMAPPSDEATNFDKAASPELKAAIKKVFGDVGAFKQK